MKITLFTANQSRHIYFIKRLSKICKELNVVQECRTIFPGTTADHYPKSNIMEKYFQQVKYAEKKLFDTHIISGINNNINILPLRQHDLSKCTVHFLSDFLDSDIYIVSGASYIKGDLLNFLVEHNAINIHVGISPYYRGTDCNFWALYDGNSHLVGATIHKLSKGLDSGPILYHALSEIKTDPFLYTMSAVKSAYDSLINKIKNETIFKTSILLRNKENEIRYSKKDDFTEDIVNSFFSKKINLHTNKFEKKLYKEPHILKDVDIDFASREFTKSY